VLADRFFSSAQGPSFPNHLYAIAAQSGGAHDNPRRTGAFRSSNTFGCDAPKGQTVTIVDSEGNEKQVQPCFKFQTEGDLLNNAGINWAYYAADPNQLGYIWSAYSAIDQIRNTPQWQDHVLPVDRVITDIASEFRVDARYFLAELSPWALIVLGIVFLLPVAFSAGRDPESRFYPRARAAYMGWGVTLYLLGLLLASQVAQLMHLSGNGY